MSDWQNWLKGLVAAIIGGVSNSVLLVIADPLTFNFNEGLSRVLTVAGTTAIISAAMYLKQSPLPKALLALALMVPLLGGCATANIEKTSKAGANCKASATGVFMKADRVAGCGGEVEGTSTDTALIKVLRLLLKTDTSETTQ